MTLNYIEQNLFEYYTVHYIVKYTPKKLYWIKILPKEKADPHESAQFNQ